MTSLAPDRQQRIIVIGAGIVGVCCALYLRRDGHDVVLVDPDGIAERTSKGNAGALSPASCIPLAYPGMWKKVPGWLLDPEGPLRLRPGYVPQALPWLLRFLAAGRADRLPAIADAMIALHAPVYDCYAPLVKAAGAEDLIRRAGTLYVYETDAAFAASASEWDMRRQRGVSVDLLEGHELRQLEPALSDRFRHGVLLSSHGHTVDPHRLVVALAAAFLRDGGRFVRGAAQSFDLADGRVRGVVLSGQTLPADRVVVAAGAWSKRLVTALGHHVPLESQRGYNVTLTDPGVTPRLPVTPVEAKIFATPMADGLRVAGTVEFAGLDAPPDERRALKLLDLVKRIYPDARTDRFTQWMGHRPCLPDTIPVIGPVPRHDNVLLAFGHGHNGMTSGPVTGRLIADLVAGRSPLIDVRPYRADRF